MRTSALFFALLSVTMVLAIAPGRESFAATACAAPSPACAATGRPDGWMPDVAQRRAELLARVESFAAEERNRGAAKQGREQWWRSIAARPVARVAR